MNEMDDLTVNLISMVLLLLNVLLAMKPFEVIALMLLDLNGILNTLLVLIAKSPSLVEASLNMEENLIARLTIINKLDLNVLVVVSQSLDDASMLSISDGIQSTSFVLSVWNHLLEEALLNKMERLIVRVAIVNYGIVLHQRKLRQLNLIIMSMSIW